MANRNDRCRVSIASKGGPCFGRGFIADPEHVITCLHVADFFVKAAGKQLSLGSNIDIITETGEALALSVVKCGDANHDVCVLKRTDGQQFPLNECALWKRGKPGDTYVGLGMSKTFREIGLIGKITNDGIGGILQLVTAEDIDNRMEPGSSGAAVFALFDGPMLGMVVEYQQGKSGKIYSAEALAEFWEGLKSADVAPTEGLPSLTIAPPEEIPCDRLVREVDRNRQKNRLILEIGERNLLKEQGFFAAGFVALPDDLPWECVNALCADAFSQEIKRLTPDSSKGVPIYSIAFGDIISESSDAAPMFLLELSRKLGADSASIDDMRKAIKTTMRPFAIILTASPSELAMLTPDLAGIWEAALKQLQPPGESQSVALFISVEANMEASIAEIAAQVASLDNGWLVTLPSLEPIRRQDVMNWANNSLKDDASGRQARDKIEQVIDAKIDGRESFRLKELKQWFSR